MKRCAFIGIPTALADRRIGITHEYQALSISYLHPMPFYTYILYSREHDTFYTGQTDHVEKRLARHNRREVRSTALYAPWELCLALEKTTRPESMAPEKKLKNLSRARLTAFIIKYGGQIPGTPL